MMSTSVTYDGKLVQPPSQGMFLSHFFPHTRRKIIPIYFNTQFDSNFVLIITSQSTIELRNIRKIENVHKYPQWITFLILFAIMLYSFVTIMYSSFDTIICRF
ncbi:hypothetical protein CORMATOL_01654 [Corynebacterium matruchotii ATCC 33806]|uniref:Uncharacterized protein n=1 Tax=Corynebacterium matruchotii ATCC 33806 TaxID=566549 RepID=C0E3T8_9CORY|nr:hypothetical protein CORMATOL_01654 [Corynebacterium matruchotii ATCC 33806]